MEATMPENAVEGSGSSALRDKAATAKAAVADLASEAKKVAFNRLSDFKSQSSEWVSAKKSTVVDRAGKLKDTVGDFVEENPYKAIAIAAGVGLLLGLLLKRRN
jgi:ElaB/YqjD/DUF883 family membrane-anchored ribosome-binding protein